LRFLWRARFILLLLFCYYYFIILHVLHMSGYNKQNPLIRT